MNDQPTSIGGPVPQQKSNRHIIWILLALILIVGAGCGAYYYQQLRIDNLYTQDAMLAKQIVSLEAQIKTVSQPAQNQNVIKITNLGFQIVVPDSIKDLTFTVTSKTNSYLSTASLTTKDAACSATTGSPLGAFARGEGVYNPKAVIASPPSLVKQFNGFYITYSSPQATCSTNGIINDMQTSQMRVLQSSLPSAQLIN